MGDGLGYKGPWGTTYPSNLRNYMNGLSEQQWMEVAKTAQYRPPMPWFTLYHMADEDLRAIYRFVKYLGPAGGSVPAYVPPGLEPVGPMSSILACRSSGLTLLVNGNYGYIGPVALYSGDAHGLAPETGCC